jgi:diguanylate cyclase (GGDEF)-like protein
VAVSAAMVTVQRPWARGTHAPSGAALATAGLAAALFATGIGFPHDDVASVVYDVVLFNAVPAAAALACELAARRVPSERWAWRAAAITLLVSIAANVALIVAPAPTFPTPTDLGYLAIVPLIAFFAGSLVRTRRPALRRSTWLDGAIGALGITAVATAYVLTPLLDVAELDPGIATMTHPVADVFTLALLGAVITALGLGRDLSVTFVGLAVIGKLVGDVALLVGQARGGYVVGGPADLGPASAALLTAVAAHHARSRPTLPGADGARTGWRVVVLPMACTAGALVVLGTERGDGGFGVADVCALGCILASLARSAVTYREVRDLEVARHVARTDELTGLPNRRQLLERTASILRVDGSAAVLLLDLDGFKPVNDTLGHAAGDELLRQVARRLTEAVGAGGLPARLGGDEFAVLLPGSGPADARRCAEDLLESLAQPYSVAGIRLQVGASIGVAATPVPGGSVTELLHAADVAMYAAKRGRGGVRVHDSRPDSETVDQLRTMADLRTALDGDQLLVHLQPLVRLTDRAVVGVEALVRWQHPVRGLLSPAELLPAARRAGLLQPLSDAVLELALSAATRWWPDRPLPVSVNLTAVDAGDLDLPDRVAGALARHGLPAAALTVDITEDDVVEGEQHGNESILLRLRALGVRTAVDDYGTGRATLLRLAHLPADDLKLDSRLTAAVTTDPNAEAVLCHTIDLAHALGLRLVAEGVEDDATAAALTRLGCDVAQGWGIAEPMPVDELLGWLARRVGAPVGAAVRRDDPVA